MTHLVAIAILYTVAVLIGLGYFLAYLRRSFYIRVRYRDGQQAVLDLFGGATISMNFPEGFKLQLEGLPDGDVHSVDIASREKDIDDKAPPPKEEVS